LTWERRARRVTKVESNRKRETERSKQALRRVERLESDRVRLREKSESGEEGNFYCFIC
jgi:hypothetical protein